MTTTRSQERRRRLQTVALPNEHGGWSFVGEPILLGLLLAPSGGGVALATAAVAAFLLRHPLRIVLRALRADRSAPRLRAARPFVVVYGAVLTTAAILVVVHAPSWRALAPMALSIPLLAAQLWYDTHNRSRDATPEIAGAVATGSLAASMVLFAGWSFGLALGVWAALAVKAIATVLYVRARLRLHRGAPASRSLPMISHGVGVAVLVGAAIVDVSPWSAPMAMGGLTVRAAIGLFAARKGHPAKVVGLQELAFGLGYVLLVAVGYESG